MNESCHTYQILCAIAVHELGRTDIPVDLPLWCLQHTATHCNTLDHTTTHSRNALQHTATYCDTLQHTATHCNTLQHTATHSCNTPERTATHGNTLQHTATRCNTLQHTAAHPQTCNTHENTQHSCNMGWL